jgi:DnaJ-class molecular chaperone
MKLERYYRALGITSTEDARLIKRAFMRVAQKYHPDKNNNDDKKNREIY